MEADVTDRPAGAPFATAHEDWDRHWRDATERAHWEAPEPLVRQIVPELVRRGVRRTLDLGCGVGRHALFLAGEGFDAVGTDASESGIALARASYAWQPRQQGGGSPHRALVVEVR
jgi:tellurite methyltransferase